jgi:CspA family cold shock protein
MGLSSAPRHFQGVSLVAEGTIKRLIADKGYGFILTESGSDLFFHMSNVEGTSFESLQERQRVTYTEGRGPKGPRAESVRPI